MAGYVGKGEGRFWLRLADLGSGWPGLAILVPVSYFGFRLAKLGSG